MKIRIAITSTDLSGGNPLTVGSKTVGIPVPWSVFLYSQRAEHTRGHKTALFVVLFYRGFPNESYYEFRSHILLIKETK